MTIDPLPLAGASSLLSVNLIDSILASDIVGLACLVVLAIISLYAWALIFAKWAQLQQTLLQNRSFLRACERDGLLESAYVEAGNYSKSTLARLLSESYFEIYHQNWFRDQPGLALDQRLSLGRQWVERAVDRAITEEISRLESRMIPLGTVSTVCPFIGLFGTVWGVLAAFQSLAAVGAADITALAPGISTALTTTIAGLFPAICAVVAYNIFQNRIQTLIAEMESYGLDLQAIFQRELLRRNSMRAVA